MTTPQVHWRTATADATRRLGRVLAPLVVPGDVVVLTGELGAGKTCLVQGLAAGLEVQVPVTSPTFMLQRVYDGRVRLVHLDVYRLERVQDVMDLGDEALAPDACTVVEWGDTVASVLPDDRLDLELRHLPDPFEPDSLEPDSLEPDPPVSDSAAAASDPTSDEPRLVVATPRGGWVDRLAALAVPDEFLPAP